MPMVVKTLLSHGWSPNVIPQSLFTPLRGDLSDVEPHTLSHEPAGPKTAWCIDAVRLRVVKALNFSFMMRYDLHVASGVQPLSGANIKLAQVHKASGLFGLRHFLIGQAPASELLIDRFLTYACLNA